jgi:hypothetical protein
MTLTCEWIKDETGALVMKWTGDDDEFSTIKPRMRKLAEFTVIFANNHGNDEAIAELKSNSSAGAVTLRRAHEVSEDAMSLSRLNGHLDFDRGIRLRVTTSTALHTSFVSHPWRIR